MLRPAKGGVILEVHLKPRAKKDEIIGLHADALKIALKAPPVEGKANKALLSFLADKLSLPRGRLKLVGGLTSRRKAIYIEGLDEEEIRRRLGF